MPAIRTNYRQNMLTQERLKDLLNYDPETGVFAWRERSKNRVKAGETAGSLQSKGYLQIRIDGRQYLAHRLVWLWMTGEWPTHYIDHVDGNNLNNRFANLRDVTNSVNQQNQRRASKDSKTGFLGVRQHHGKFQARIYLDGKVTHLGRFTAPEQAYAAYVAAKRVHHVGNTL
jgi:hypothetical protein